MAFLDEVGLTELWSLIKEKDDALAAADAKVASGSITPTARYDYVSVDIGFKPDAVIVGMNDGMFNVWDYTGLAPGGILWDTNGVKEIDVRPGDGTQGIKLKVNGSIISATYQQNPDSYGTMSAYWLAVKF